MCNGPKSNKEGYNCLFPVNLSQLHYRMSQQACEERLSNFVVSARNLLTSMLDYTVMQMIKVTSEKGH